MCKVLKAMLNFQPARKGSAKNMMASTKKTFDVYDRRLRRIGTDSTIVVGGKEYQHCRSLLSQWSDYFRLADEETATCAFVETPTWKFEFPDRDPKEWEWIVSLTAPASEEKVTTDTVEIALCWFDELRSPIGVETCDRVLYSMVLQALADDFTLETITILLWLAFVVGTGRLLGIVRSSNCMKVHVKFEAHKHG